MESLGDDALQKERRIGLTGTAVSDYPNMVPLCRRILEQHGGVSLSSLRVDAVHSPLIQCLKEAECRTVAIAPEAGSERLRRIVRKAYKEEEILEAVKTLVENGIAQIKCYFMIGLPFETDEDVKSIPLLAKRIRHRILSSGESKKRWRVVLSVNPFIPKPGTPFQWAPLDDVRELKRKLKMIQAGLKNEKGIQMIYDLPKWAYVQALLSNGDRRVAKIVRAVHQNGGDWGKALRESSVNPDFFVYRTRDLDEIFPWDFIDHGISKETLKKEYLKAREEAETTR